MSKHHLTAALREMETQTLNPVSIEFRVVQTAGQISCLSFFFVIFEADSAV